MENFSNNKYILTKTRRSNAYAKLNKIKYVKLLSLLVINNNLNIRSNSYFSLVISELSNIHWKFYSSIITNNAGLIPSNHYKSILFQSLLPRLYNSDTKLAISYYYNLEVMQFSLHKNTFSKILMFYLCSIASTWVASSLNFNIKTSFIWVNWYLRFNPMNNVFYLKIYNY